MLFRSNRFFCFWASNHTNDCDSRGVLTSQDNKKKQGRNEWMINLELIPISDHHQRGSSPHHQSAPSSSSTSEQRRKHPHRGPPVHAQQPEFPPESKAVSAEFAAFLDKRLERSGVADISRQGWVDWHVILHVEMIDCKMKVLIATLKWYNFRICFKHGISDIGEAA